MNRLVPAAAVVAAALAGGCTKPGRQMVAVRGAVTFQGRPVTAGCVQFNDPLTGSAPTADLKADGTYDLKLLEGSYAVCVTPALVNKSSPDGLPNWVYAAADDIPAKYRDGARSGFTAAVSAEATSFDFAMTK
jgi:hypothetical protein